METALRRRRSGQAAALSIEASKERCKTLSGFIREAWHVVEPGSDYVHGWHIDAIAQHLEAITYGQITRLIINVPPGPMREDSIVETARGPIRLSDVVVGDYALTHRGRYMPVTAVHHQGVLPILKITTNSGRVTQAAYSHPYLTPDGWVDAKDLRVGSVLAVVNRQEDRPCQKAMQPEEARLLGYLVGDGSLTQATASFVNADREVIDDFKRCALACGFETSEIRRLSHWQVRLLGGQQVRDFLACHGLFGKSSYHKRMPPRVMAGDRETIGNFVGGFWTCDGGFDVRPTKSRGSRFRAYGTTVSEGLAHDLVYSLGLLGIEARFRTKRRRLNTAAQPGGWYVSYSIEVQREEMTARFAGVPGLCSAKQKKVAACRAEFYQPLWNDPIISIEEDIPAPCMCLTIAVDGSFVCSGIAVKNTMKSLEASVFWPAWEWGPAGLAHHRYLTTSYSDTYVTRDSRRMRDLVMSDWYQARWGETVRLTRYGETSFENSATGWREGVPFRSLTGGRGHRVIIDDPHSTETAESDAERTKVIRTFRESVPTRLVDPAKSAIMIIMQRLHQNDVTGSALALRLGYEHLCLPMEFEMDRRCSTSIGFTDPRSYEGELLFPERFSRAVVDRDKAAMGSYAVAGQFQQRPTLREGGLFKKAWFRLVSAVPAGTRFVRYWDLAATAEQLGATSAYTVGLKLGKQPNGRYIVADVNRLRAEGYGVRRMIMETAASDGPMVEVGLPIDPGQAGKAQAQDMVLMLAGYVVHAVRESGDKVTRAEPIAAQAEAGNLDVLQADWTETFIDECTNFPAGAFKDQVDALSGAFSRLIGRTVYNVPEPLISMEPVKVLALWPRASALVISRDTVACVWGAKDPAKDTINIYDCYYVPRREMAIHAEAIRSRGPWIPCVFDLEDGRSRDEGMRIASNLSAMSVDINVAPMDEEAAIEDVSMLLATSKLRVFSSLSDWFVQYRRYSRADDGKIDGEASALLRATGLLANAAMSVAITENRAISDRTPFDNRELEASTTTGY